MTVSLPGRAQHGPRARCPLSQAGKEIILMAPIDCRGGRSPFRGRGWRPDTPAPL